MGKRVDRIYTGAMANKETKQVINTSGQTLEVIGYGIVKADEVIDVALDFNNANFEAAPSPKSAKEAKSTTTTKDSDTE